MADVFLFLGSYAGEDEVRADYDAVNELHRAGRLRAYDAGLLARDARGQVHVEIDEVPTRLGTWTGAAVAALAGLLLPPETLVPGAATDALAGHLRRLLSDSQLREFRDVLQIGRIGLVVVAGSKVDDLLDERLTDAVATVEKAVPADSELVQALKQASAPASGSPSG